MEKLKATRKDIDGYNTIAVQASALYYMLYDISPIAYNSGVYGWNWDAYVMDDGKKSITICTGYRSLVGRHIDYTTIKGWNDRARQIVEDHSKKYDDRIQELKALQNEFICFVHDICLEELKKTRGF